MNFFRELVRDILDLAENVEAGPADPEHGVCKAKEFIEVVGVISALSDQDVDRSSSSIKFAASLSSSGQVFDILSCTSHAVSTLGLEDLDL